MEFDTPDKAPADRSETLTSAPAPEPPKPTRKRIIDAVKLKDHAKSHARWAEHKAKSSDRIGALAAHHDAAQMHERADKDLTPWAYTTRNRQPPGNGGELVPLPEPEKTYRRDVKRMAVEELPDVLAHQASSDAMDLAARGRRAATRTRDGEQYQGPETGWRSYWHIRRWRCNKRWR